MPILSKTITQRINRLAHALALQHETSTRRELMARLTEALADGKTHADVEALLDRIEADGLDVVAAPSARA